MLSLGLVKKSKFLKCRQVVLRLCNKEKIFFICQKKEQCLALGTQLRTLFKISDYKIYRIFPNSEVQYLHPKDGVFPEKLNEGRLGVGNIGHSIGKNAEPVNVKFTGKNTFG
jgi:photosystem I subunit 2